MGSVVISDVVPDIARFPHRMVVGDVHQPYSTAYSVPENRTRPPQSPAANQPPSFSTPSSNRSTSTENAGTPRHAYHNLPTSTPVASSWSRNSTVSHSQDAALEHNPNSSGTRTLQNEGPAYGHGRSSRPVSAVPLISPPSPRLQPTYRSSISLASGFPSPNPRIVVRDLDHIQSFASEEVLTRSRHGSRRSLHSRQEAGQQYEISAMPVTDIIEMVAGLLTKITTTNDRQHEHMHRHIVPPEGASGLSPQTTSVLAFHGKNVPSITILSYLSRIHKYCPTTYEVFLSLLVYFDRMTEMVNSGSLQSFREVLGSGPRDERPRSPPTSPAPHPASRMVATPPSSGFMDAQDYRGTSSFSNIPSKSSSDEVDNGLSQYFVVDSFNIHRLVIAGVTCASKFFSDVFYTNSRYAKVGGLPLPELNHLELQFLLLNDFRLSIPVEELEAYGTMLVEFYAREVIAQQSSVQAVDAGLYMQAPTPP